MVRRAGRQSGLEVAIHWADYGMGWQGGGGQTASSYRTQHNKYRLAVPYTVYRMYLVADSVVNVTQLILSVLQLLHCCC